MAKVSNGSAEVVIEMCARCGVKPRASGHTWCNSCKAEKQQDYNGNREEMLERRGFARGIQAMRMHLARNFALIGGNGGFTQDEVAGLILQAQAPEYSPDQAT